MKISIKGLYHRYDRVEALKNVDLEVQEGELIALLGPSGCGKTTLLKSIAGLTDVYSGAILLGDKEITNLAPQKRETALVFQNYALFPHMTVEENIDYGLKIRKQDKSLRGKKIREILSSVKLEGYEKRKIHELSGGQQQRVALARALVIEPAVLLFDEPLSNLDEKLRVTMRKEIRRIQQAFGITSLYVTHDQEEAMAIADRIAVMEEGVIHQISTPREAYFQPRNKFVATFMGTANFLPFEYEGFQEDKHRLRIFKQEAKLPMNRKAFQGEPFEKMEHGEISKNYTLMIRPENIEFHKEGIPGTVKWVEPLGSVVRYNVEVEGHEIILMEINRIDKEITIGEEVKVRFDWDKAHLIVS